MSDRQLEGSRGRGGMGLWAVGSASWRVTDGWTTLGGPAGESSLASLCGWPRWGWGAHRHVSRPVTPSAPPAATRRVHSPGVWRWMTWWQCLPLSGLTSGRPWAGTCPPPRRHLCTVVPHRQRMASAVHPALRLTTLVHLRWRMSRTRGWRGQLLTLETPRRTRRSSTAGGFVEFLPASAATLHRSWALVAPSIVLLRRFPTVPTMAAVATAAAAAAARALLRGRGTRSRGRVGRSPPSPARCSSLTPTE